MNELNYMQISNDKNGNPRFVVHFSEFLTETEKESNMLAQYDIAKKRAKKLYNCREYKGNDFGGGFIFQALDYTHARNKVESTFS